MRILALDLGSKTGWCVDGASGAIDLGLGDGRFPIFSDFLADLIVTHRPDHAFYERPVPHSTAVRETMYGLRGVALSVCGKHMIGCQMGAAPNTLKKWFVGNGAAPKELIVAECRRRGHQPEGEDEADAIALWYFCKANASEVAG